jgi:hypothetical protein
MATNGLGDGVKAQVNRFGTPTATELKSSTDISSLPWPGQVKRRAKVRSMGYGVRSDFELNFGRYPFTMEQLYEGLSKHLGPGDNPPRKAG